MRSRIEPNVIGLNTESGGLPNYMRQTERGLVFDPKVVAEGESGPFAIVGDYGLSLEGLREPTAVSYWPEGVQFHSEVDPVVDKSFRGLTLLIGAAARDEKIDIGGIYFGVVYSASFTTGYARVFRKVASEIRGEWTLLAPWRGGEPIQDICQALGFNPHIPKFKASRVVLKNGRYHVGIREIDKVINIAETIVVGDDCRAGGGSEDICYRWAIDRNPRASNLLSVVGVGVKRSSGAIARTWNNEAGLTYASHVGRPANAMNQKYYLVVTDEERRQGLFPEHCDQSVGDMGLAMGMSNPARAAVLKPVVKATAQGRVNPELVFEVVDTVVADPGQLRLQAERIMAECGVVV